MQGSVGSGVLCVADWSGVGYGIDVYVALIMARAIGQKGDLVCVGGFFMPYRFATELGGKSSRTQQKASAAPKILAAHFMRLLQERASAENYRLS